MGPNHRPSNRCQSSIKYKTIFEPADVRWLEDLDRTSSSCGQPDKKQSVSKPPNSIVSTTKLLSSVGNAWECLSLPSFLKPKGKEEHNEVGKREAVLHFSDYGRNNKGLNLNNLRCLSPELASLNTQDHPKISQKKLQFEPLHGDIKSFSTWAGCSYFPVNFFRTGGALGISYDLGRIYEPVFESCRIRFKHTTQSLTSNIIHIRSTSITSTNLSDSVTTQDVSNGEHVDAAKNVKQPFESLHSAYSLGSTTTSDDDLSKTFSSRLYADYHIEFMSVDNCKIGDHQLPANSQSKSVDNSERVYGFEHKNSHENCVRRADVFLGNIPTANLWYHMHDKTYEVFAKHRHAVAGALAGIFVSFCLHPFDTVKTIIQARALDHSVYCILETVMSERGVMGLYRGITSNIASSAPISAVYTYTYESVKSALLPLFPMEHHSVVHCAAGGCASIATSFIFTPSERIKQQMQVRVQYHSCWSALIGIVAKGGLTSLYAGWGAVLCRNIPHSVIKFYTYEKLKKLLKFSTHPIGHSDTVQTIICGGLAGCTAAFFTTPFDVVKTRLQTQIPGSLGRYNGVFPVLEKIAMEEGLRGLYRGLTPRLVMYVSQGALFFTSYEFFKSVFSPDVQELSE